MRPPDEISSLRVDKRAARKCTLPASCARRFGPREATRAIAITMSCAPPPSRLDGPLAAAKLRTISISSMQEACIALYLRALALTRPLTSPPARPLVRRRDQRGQIDLADRRQIDG